jgi:hypothetical protein
MSEIEFITKTSKMNSLASAQGVLQITGTKKPALGWLMFY